MYDEITTFIKGLYAPKERIFLHEPAFIGNEKKYLNDCIDSTFVSSVGKYVDRFEEMVAQYTGAARAVVCVNGTNGLHLALLLSDVEPGDEVITQPLTFIATANAISYAGAHPVFLDVDRLTMGLSPDAVRNWLSRCAEIKNKSCYNKQTGRRIKACMPMHTFGHPARLDELAKICKTYHLELIEDAAESLGSFYKGQHTGTIGRIGVLSFNGNKTITTGGGGMLLFTDEKLAQRAKHLTTQAKVSHPWEFVHDAIGYNYRMPNLNAALGCAQMEKLEEILAGKRVIAEAYRRFFAQTEIHFFGEPENCRSNYWLNAILLPDRKQRDAFLEYSNGQGIATRPIWQLMNKLPMFESCQHDELTQAAWFEERVVNLPSSYRPLTDK